MDWPRGKYNGRKIVGVVFRVVVDVAHWRFIPAAYWNYGSPSFKWLCFRVFAEANYSSEVSGE